MRWRHRGNTQQAAAVQPAVMQTPDACVATGNGAPLNSLRPGATAEVSGIQAGCKARCRLASLGLIPGSRLHVVANPGIGPLLLSVGDSRLMVERGIAAKVLVQQL